MDNKLEYIPGDLVMVKESALQFAKDKIFKVISSLSGGFLKVVMLNDSSTTYSISNNAIRPIPLTPEILKKNGWEKLYEKFFEKNVNNIRLTIEFSENIYVAINRIFIMEIISTNSSIFSLVLVLITKWRCRYGSNN